MDTTQTQTYIAATQCVDRGVYAIRSRNLIVGVFDAQTQGFIGIRNKFGSDYLFTEYHHDTGAPHGTVRPTKLLMMLPENIELKETLEGTTCETCHEELVFVPENPLKAFTPGTWVHIAKNDCEDPAPVGHQYQPLFVFLERVQAALAN